MKTSLSINEQLLYTLREIYTLQKSVISDEDMTSFNKETLERCFQATKVKHPSRIRLSRTIPEKSVVLLYELLKNPLCQRKSRQIAVIVFLMFLYTHGYWINLPVYEFKSLILWIETSHRLTQKETIEGIRKIVLSNIQTIDL